MRNKKLKLAPVWVIVFESCTVTRERDSDDEWDYDDVCYSQSIKGFTVDKPKSHWPAYEFNVQRPILDKYYFVYVNYDTGDSFHREDGVMVEVGLFDNEKDAKFVIDLIEKDSKKEESSIIKTTLPSGKPFQLYTGTWKGYFECYQSANFEVVTRI